ncbi:MAG TPA: hypothetical protein VM734_04545 [Kofleriaceae bacterium]|nr:hypothetical protein [Kofleriaceae bacterium]
MSAAPFSGNRHFTWFTPAGRRPTQYESYTVGQQSTPAQWLHVDWPVRFDDGRPPWIAESTALRTTRWSEFRDPSQTWQRPYVAQRNIQEQALATLVPEALRGGLADALEPAWRDRVLATYYAAWPFVEYGEFLSLCYAVREALSDTITMALAFEVSDKLRHGQDIVHYLLALEEAVPGFSDAGARAAWMTDPALVPLRETIERINASNDWAEIAVALNLVLEPLAGELFKTELLSRLAPLNGDAVTPMILGSVRQDARRHVATTQALVRIATDDPDTGAANREVVRGWLARWTPEATAVARALAALFELPGVRTVPFAPAFERVRARHGEIVAALGLDGGRP